MIEPFQNRTEAGRALALALANFKNTGAVTLAIPRGGVVVAYEVAVSLSLDMDVIVPRKIPAPFQEELAIGAVASWGDPEPLMDSRSVACLAVGNDYIERQARLQIEEINRRLMLYRGSTEPPPIAGRNVLLIDDGIATGYTTRAAALALRRLGARRIVLAVPVGPPDSVAAMGSVVDTVVCLRTPDPFMAVGYWYRDFRQVQDGEVIELLSRAASRRASD